MIFDKAKQAFALQAKARRLQKELKSALIEESALDGKVRVVVSGEQKIQSIQIDPSLLQPGGKDNLEHFLKNALNAALSRAQEQAANKMKEITGDLDWGSFLKGK